MNRRSALILFVLSMMIGCANPYTQVPIASSATVSKDWTEIHPNQPLRWTRPVQEVDFRIDSPHERSAQAEIIGPNGERWVPEMELVSSDGKTFPMDAHGFWGEDMYFTRDKPADLGTIKAIRFRSKVPIRISNLTWTGYDPAKVKR